MKRHGKDSPQAQLIYLSALLLFLPVSQPGIAQSVPYPAALQDAAIHVGSLDSILDQSLLIGNGDINALIFEEDGVLVMTLTKNDVWDARLDTANDPPLPTLDLVKHYAFSETGFQIQNSNSGQLLPEGMEWSGKDSYHANPYPCPRACAKLTLGKNPGAGSLDLHKASVSVREGKSGTGAATIRALAQRNCFLIQCKEAVDLHSVVSEGIPKARQGERDGVHWIEQTLPGDLDWPGMSFAVAVASDGDRKAVAIVTSIERKKPVAGAVQMAKRCLQAKDNRLIRKHEEIWNTFWSKSGIEIEDSLLQRTWYRNLYFLRCVSKPGAISPGLFAGLINDTPAWHGDYHTNYNIQSTFWGAYPANQHELAEPYDRLISDYLPRAQWIAKQVYDMEGAYYPHVLYAYEPPHPEQCKSVNGRQYFHHTWAMTLGVPGFTVQPLWWHYKYAPDREFLETVAYPPLREVAVFYADFIEHCEGDDTVLLAPSVSPEHWGWTENFERNRNCAFDIAMFRYTLEAAIEAAERLQTDRDLVKRFENAIKRLPPYPLFGHDNPIVVDVQGAPPIEYNIAVPATPVFPGDVVTAFSSCDEKTLFKRTIADMKWNGNNSTNILGIARARLSFKDSQDWLRKEVLARTRPNGTMSLNRLEPQFKFNDFGHYTEQYGTVMSISELLVQSVGDVIRLMPALESGCRARFTDLRAQGGFLIDAEGMNGKITGLCIESTAGETLRLASPWPKIKVQGNQSDRFKTLKPDKQGIVTIQTNPGDVFIFQAGS